MNTGVRRTILALLVTGIVGAAIRLRGTGGKLRRKGPGWTEVDRRVEPPPERTVPESSESPAQAAATSEGVDEPA